MAQSKMQEVKSTMWKEVESSSGNFWNPERVGDVLEGLLCKVNADGKYGKVWTVLNMENQEISTPSHKFLQNLMSGIPINSVVRIVYHGELPPKVRGENPMKTYKVFVAE